MSTRAILRQIKSLGYHITAHDVNGTIELHAIKLDGSEPPQIARCNDGNGPDEQYKCACLLAAAVGIELDDSSDQEDEVDI